MSGRMLPLNSAIKGLFLDFRQHLKIQEKILLKICSEEKVVSTDNVCNDLVRQS